MFSGIERITRSNFNETVSKLKDALSDFSLESVKLATSQMNLETVQAKAIFTAKGLTGAELEQAVATATLSASQKGATATTGGLGTAFKGLYATLAPFIPIIAVIAGAGAAMYAAWYFSIDQTIKRNQKLRDSLEETTNALKDEAKEADNNANTLSDLCDKYEEAIKGSNEYYNIANQIAELSPQLVIGYTNEGNAILDNTEKIREQTEAYRENARVKRESIKESADENIDTFLNQYSDYESKKNKEESDYSKAKDLYDKEFAKPFEDRDLNFIENQQTMMDESLARIKKYSDEMVDIEEDLRDSYLSLLPEIDDSVLTKTEEAIRSTLLSWATQAKITSNNFEDMYNKVSSDNDISKKISELYTLDTSEMSVSDAQTEIDKYVSEISEYLGMESDKLKLVLNLDINDSLQKAKKKYVGSYSSGTAANSNRSNEQLNVNDWLDSLSKEEIDIVNSDAFEQALEKERKALDGAALTADNYANALKNVSNAEKESSGNGSGFNPESFKESLSSLSSLQSLYADFKENANEGIDFTFNYSDIDALREKFGDTCESFDDFVRLATTTGTSANDMQGAFDRLATEYVVGSGALDGLNSSTREQIISQLELQGIVGANELLTEELSAAYGYCSAQGYSLADATNASYWALLDEYGASETTKGSIYALATAEIAYNNTGLDVQGKIAQLGALAKAYGDTATSAIAAAAADRVAAGHGDYETILSDMMSSINRVGKSVKLSIGQSSANAAKSASKGAKDSKDAWLEAYKEQKAALEHSLSMEEITERDYYAKLQELNETYFNDSEEHHKKYLDEYQSNEEKIFKGLKKIREDALKEEKSSLDDVISHMSLLVDKKIDSYKDKMSSITDEYEKQKDAAIERYDKEIEKIEDQIDAKQDEIDAINDVNDAMDKQKALEEALYNLRQAQNQKSRVYKQTDENGGQVVYDTDSRAISSANDEAYKAQNELRIFQLEQEKEALEDLKDSYEEKKEQIEEYYEKLISSTEEYYNRLIEGQESIKSRWEELAELQEQAEIQSKLDEMGLLEQGVADMSDEAFQKLKLSYLDVLKDMNEGNTGILNQLSILSGVDMSGLMGYLETSQGMLAGLAGINIQPVNDSIAAIPEQTAMADTAIVNTTDSAKQKIGQVSESLNSLTNEVSSYQLPALNTEQFSASLGADGLGGVIGDLNTFVQKFRDICGSIPQIWNDTMSILQGTQGSVGGEGTDYNSIFAPLITAMNNCKLQIDEKLSEYVSAWRQFNLDLGGIVGVGASSGGGLALPTSPTGMKDASGGKDTGKANSSGGSDTIVGTIQTGGEMVSDSFENEWIPAFSNLGTNINEICSKIVMCVNEMATETVNACREAIDAINKANAAKKSSSSNNKKPAKFEGSAYVGQAFASGSDISIDKDQVALVNEIGKEGIVRNGRLHTIYGGAQFVTLQKGDIVFNHKQMEELEKHRRVISGGGHGTMIGSFAGGSSLKINEPPKKLQAMITPEFKRAMAPDIPPSSMERMLEHTSSTQTNILQDIKVTLPNVTNEAGFNHFAKELKNLKLEALQRSYRRM